MGDPIFHEASETVVGPNGTWTFGGPSLGGGMSAVRAGTGADGVAVAVKVVATPDDDERDLARREARHALTAAAAGSPHLTPILDVAESADRLVIVMPRADGHLLVDPAGADPREVTRSMREIATGLRVLHELGIVHRDLKPQNVLVFGGTLALADYGLARDADTATGSPTRKGWRTPHYEAPELADGARASYRSDLYALGCLAFELLAGRPPFTGTETAVREGHARGVPAPLPATVPPRLARLVEDLMRIRPEDRPRDAEEVVGLATRIAVPPRPSPSLVAALGAAAQDRAGSEAARAEAERDAARCQWRRPRAPRGSG